MLKITIFSVVTFIAMTGCTKVDRGDLNVRDHTCNSCSLEAKLIYSVDDEVCNSVLHDKRVSFPKESIEELYRQDIYNYFEYDIDNDGEIESVIRESWDLGQKGAKDIYYVHKPEYSFVQRIWKKFIRFVSKMHDKDLYKNEFIKLKSPGSESYVIPSQWGTSTYGGDSHYRLENNPVDDEVNLQFSKIRLYSYNNINYLYIEPVAVWHGRGDPLVTILARPEPNKFVTDICYFYIPE